MFPMYEYARSVRLKLKMRTTSCGDVVCIVNDLFKKCVSNYILLVSLLSMDFHQRTLLLLFMCSAEASGCSDVFRPVNRLL